MAHLLGQVDCIVSLQRDLDDIQASIAHVSSRTGPVCQASWKFPHLLARDLDIQTLQQEHDYVEHEESWNQLSHVVLLELIIDRLLLLLQSSNVYMQQLRCHDGKQKSQKGCRSAGLVVKSFWKNLVQFAEYKSSKETAEPSVTPCDACRQAQSVLWKTGKALVDLLQSEGLPSSLQSLLEVVKDTLGLGHMTAFDVTQLASEQLRDVRRLQKHFRDVHGTVERLQERATGAEKELEKFQLQVADFEEEIVKHQNCIIQLDTSLRALKESQKTLEEEKQLLTEENLMLEEKISSQQNYLRALESVKNVLAENVRILEEKEEATTKHQETVQLLLDKERAKYNSARRQQESMQVKQLSLLVKVDSLDKECEDLQRRLEGQEEKEDDLHKQLKEVSEEKENLQVRYLENLKEKKTLEKSRDELKETVNTLVRVLKKREQLSVAFPEFSLQAQAQSKGSDHATEEPAPAQAHTPPQYNTVHREVTPDPLTREDAIDCPRSPTWPPKASWRRTRQQIVPVPVQTSEGPIQRPAPETPEPHHSAHEVCKSDRGDGGEDEKWRLRVRRTAPGSEAHARSVALRLPKRPRPKLLCKPWKRQTPSFSLFSMSVKSGAGSRLRLF